MSPCQAALSKYNKKRVCSIKGSHVCQRTGKLYCGRHKKLVLPDAPPPAPPSTASPVCGICDCDLILPANTCVTFCSHRFHRDCMVKWKGLAQKGTACPTCHIRLTVLDDPVAMKLKQTPIKFAAFQLWCLQQTLDKKLVKSPDKNRSFFFKREYSLTLREECDRICRTMDHQQRILLLSDICINFPTIFL